MAKSNGVWEESEAHKFKHSANLAQYLQKKFEPNELVYDFGCGLGYYLCELKKSGFENLCGFEGQFFSGNLFDGTIYYRSLTEHFHFVHKGNVISIDVGQYIPFIYEPVYFKNISAACSDYLIISWAIPDTAQSVDEKALAINERSNEYVIASLSKFGLEYKEKDTFELRDYIETEHEHLKNGLMVFRKFRIE